MPDQFDRTKFLEDGIDQVLSRGEEALAELCRQRPDLAGVLRRKVEALRDLGLLGVAGGEAPRNLGKYRLIECIGRGGMGAVYRAEQTDLGRMVALKLIRGDQLYFEGARERFRREVEAIARLQVTGVVPILDVGAVDGVPFYAMELLAGTDLGAVLRVLQAGRDRSFQQAVSDSGSGSGAERDSGFFDGGDQRVAARIGLKLARTMARVHEHGIVHRDIKPSNVVIDQAGRVTIVDFGLAHLSGAGELTRTGALLGSLPYMAPEQVRGDRDAVGPRTDIYAIGMTLHELVYRQPAFAGDQVQLIEQIARGRARRRDGPRDLETIIARATDPDAARRYPTADALADDLVSLLEYRPIAARPSGVGLRLVRWGQRNRVAAMAAVALLLLAVAVPTAVAIERSSALAEVRAERDRYERTITGVADVLAKAKPLLGEVAELEGGPTAERVRELFRSMADFYAELRRFDPKRESIRKGLVVAAFREIELLVHFGDYERAEQQSAEVLAATEGEVEAASLRYELRMIRARMFDAGGDYARAEREWTAAIAELDGHGGDEFIDRLRRARCRYSLANMLSMRRDPRALDVTTEAMQAFERLLAEDPDHDEVTAFVAKARRALAQIRSRTGDVDGCFEVLERARADLESALQRRPHNRTLEFEVALTEHVLGQECRMAGRHADAVPHLDAAIRLRSRFWEVWPQRPSIVCDLADSLSDLGSSLNSVGELEQAGETLVRARELLEAQLQETPDIGKLERTLIDVYMELGTNLRRRHGPSDEAHALSEQAVSLIEQRIASQSDPQPELYGVRAATRGMCAQSHYEHGRFAEAQEMAKQAASDMRRFADQGDPLMKRQCWQATILAAICAARRGEVGDVEELLRQADEVKNTGRAEVGFLSGVLGEAEFDALMKRLGK